MMSDEENVDTKKKKKVSKYNYQFGDVHPGRKYKSVFGQQTRIPDNMGWRWDAKPRKGWQPGVVGKSVAKNMTFKCPRSGFDKDKGKGKKKKKKGADGAHKEDSSEDEPLQPKPTLKIQRKGDVFTIQVNPLKDLTELKFNEDPYVDCDPLIFKIIKKRSPEEKAKVEARRLVKMKRERDAEIRRNLAEAVEDICKCAYMDVYCNDLTAIDNVIESCPAFTEPDCVCKSESLSSLSSNGTWDIEYTPPFGCFDLGPRKKKILIHVETQYAAADLDLPDSSKSNAANTAGSKKGGKKAAANKKK